jgi:hypothetical protein
MEPNHERILSEQPRPPEPPAPKKRFRIHKLEERIAPQKGGFPSHRCTGCCEITCGCYDTYGAVCTTTG